MIQILIIVLATARLTLMLTLEDGPMRVFDRLRGLPFLCDLLACSACTSVWVAVPLTWYALSSFSWPVVDWVVFALAVSMAAIIVGGLARRVMGR